MKKFLGRCILFAIGIIALWIAYIVGRIVMWQGAVMESMQMDPSTDVLFVGDSHVGATFEENKQYRDKVLWGSSLPTQISLMRLEDMERLGKLSDIRIVVTDFGLQTIGQQRKDRMAEFFWRLIPITWRHSPRILGLWRSPLEWLSYPIMKPKWNIILKQSPKSSNIPITERTEKEREEDFASIRKFHFTDPTVRNGYPEGWEKRLKIALHGMADICQRNDIHLIIISSPVTSYYRAGIPTCVGEKLRDFQAFMMSENIEYHDLRDWSDKMGRGDADFKDCFHFTDDARLRFTSWFYEEYLR